MSRPGIAEKLGQTRPGSAGSNGTAGQTTEGAANTIATETAPKIERQIGRRGLDNCRLSSLRRMHRVEYKIFGDPGSE